MMNFFEDILNQRPIKVTPLNDNFDYTWGNFNRTWGI